MKDLLFTILFFISLVLCAGWIIQLVFFWVAFLLFKDGELIISVKKNGVKNDISNKRK